MAHTTVSERTLERLAQALGIRDKDELRRSLSEFLSGTPTRRKMEAVVKLNDANTLSINHPGADTYKYFRRQLKRYQKLEKELAFDPVKFVEAFAPEKNLPWQERSRLAKLRAQRLNEVISDVQREFGVDRDVAVFFVKEARRRGRDLPGLARYLYGYDIPEVSTVGPIPNLRAISRIFFTENRRITPDRLARERSSRRPTMFVPVKVLGRAVYFRVPS